jgi:predicted acetyltransferase
METMKFVFPCKAYEQKARDYIQEFIEHGSAINGAGGLDRYLRDSTYADWLAKVRSDIDLANIPEGRVAGYTYFYVRESTDVNIGSDEIVGMINIRLVLTTDFLREQGGHIGYSVRPTQRRKGYGTRMLRETLAFCRTIGLRDFILTCNKSNPASAGVIINCGGVLEAEFYSEFFKEVIQRYRIP